MTLLASTLLYLVMWQIHAAFLGWALASILLGLGFTFFSGATEAWLVDALGATGFAGSLESVFGRAQTVSGAAMLVGLRAGRGGRAGDRPRRAVPAAGRDARRDPGRRRSASCTTSASGRAAVPDPVSRGAERPARLDRRRLAQSARALADAGGAVHERRRLLHVLRRSSRTCCELYGDTGAYGIAGLAAAIFAGAQILGGLLVPRVRRLFRRRTDALLIGGAINVVFLVLIGGTGSFVIALALLTGWALVFAVEGPLRQAFINGCIPSEQRATVLSFDSLMGSTGGVVFQPCSGPGRRCLRLRAVVPRLGGRPGPVVAVHRRSRAGSGRRADLITRDEAPPAAA